MKAKNSLSDELRREIELRAYLIWESEGRPHGREKEHWQRAEAEVLGAAAAKPETKVTPKLIGKAVANGVAKAVVAAKAKKPTKGPKQDRHH